MNIGLLLHDAHDREALSKSLVAMHHHPVIFHSSNQVMGELLSAHHNGHAIPIALLVLDLYQPGEISGMDLIERLRQHIPHDKLAFLVAIGPSPQEQRLAETHHLDVATLRKPIMASRMLARLAEQHEVIYGSSEAHLDHTPAAEESQVFHADEAAEAAPEQPAVKESMPARPKSDPARRPTRR